MIVSTCRSRRGYAVALGRLSHFGIQGVSRMAEVAANTSDSREAFRVVRAAIRVLPSDLDVPIYRYPLGRLWELGIFPWYAAYSIFTASAFTLFILRSFRNFRQFSDIPLLPPTSTLPKFYLSHPSVPY